MKHYIIPFLFTLTLIYIISTNPGTAHASETEANDIRLVDSGKSDYTIVLSKEASKSEHHAAQELQKFLCEISGAELPIITEEDNLPERMIVIGDGSSFRSLNSPINLKDLGDEGFVIRSVRSHVIIAGGRLRGTLYGVYTFLEEVLGCRWYTSCVSTIPKSPTITLKSLDITQKPDFEYREPFYTDAWDPDWAARNKANGNHTRLDDQRGGKIRYLPFVHSFDALVPKAEYFEKHPEYYSLVNGQRRGGQSEGQLCLTNPDVQQIAMKTVMRWMDENPNVTIFSVSQNDNMNYCRCQTCAAVDAEEGSPAGLMLRFVNTIAAEAAQKNPGKLVDTLAYQYTEKPPKITRPLPNVRIRLCPIGNCQHHPYEKRCCQPNTAFMENLSQWDELTDSLYIWHYNTNFANYLLPLPDLDQLTTVIPLYKQSGVKGVFMEGTYNAVGENRSTGGGGFMDDLKQYLIAKLLWNTKAEVKVLRDDFLKGFYGQSAEPVGVFLDLLHEKVQKDLIHGFIFNSPDDAAAFLTPEVVKKSNQLFDKAEQMAENGEILARVKHARLSLEYFTIMQEARRAGTSGTPAEKTEALRKLDDLATRCKADGILQWSEGATVDTMAERYSAPLR